MKKNTSTGQEVDFVEKNLANRYKNVKGDAHKPNAANEFYMTDPVAKKYMIHCTYPELQNPPYNNGLRAGWSYATDVYAPGMNTKPFSVIGITSVKLKEG